MVRFLFTTHPRQTITNYIGAPQPQKENKMKMQSNGKLIRSLKRRDQKKVLRMSKLYNALARRQQEKENASNDA